VCDRQASIAVYLSLAVGRIIAAVIMRARDEETPGTLFDGGLLLHQTLLDLGVDLSHAGLGALDLTAVWVPGHLPLDVMDGVTLDQLSAVDAVHLALDKDTLWHRGLVGRAHLRCGECDGPVTSTGRPGHVDTAGQATLGETRTRTGAGQAVPRGAHGSQALAP
jgi:hypothetical protein